VAFRYGRGDPWVLRDVSISLPPGRILLHLLVAAALPGTALHLVLWTGVMGTLYVSVRRVRH
jgi:hypothetical protein